MLDYNVLSKVRYNQSELEMKLINGTELMTETSLLGDMQLQPGGVQWKKPPPSPQGSKRGSNGWR